jgi:hypothetical protein
MMNKLLLLVALVATLAAGLFVAGPAAASSIYDCTGSTWLAARNCVNTRFDNQLNAIHSLQAQVATLKAQVATLNNRNATLLDCITEFPTSKSYDANYYYYGNDTNGDGNFDQNIFQSNALNNVFQQTPSGSGVDLWILHDVCGTSVFGRPPAP